MILGFYNAALAISSVFPILLLQKAVENRLMKHIGMNAQPIYIQYYSCKMQLLSRAFPLLLSQAL